jgi:hypothetical protein
MTTSWWFVWLLFMLVVLVPPVGYGWGYRGWGPPYPRYVQRRRGERAVAAGTAPTFDHGAWGRGGDFVWVMGSIGVFWVLLSLLWR